MTTTPVRVARDASRSRAFWELRRALGDEEAARRWPEALRDLRAMQPELSPVAKVDVVRERGEASYRESARALARVRLRSSGRSRRHSLGVIAVGGLQLLAGQLFGPTLFLTIAGTFLAGVGAMMLASSWRRDEIQIDHAGLRVIQGGRVVTELERGEIAFLEVRSVHDEQLVAEIGLGLRFAMRDKEFAASWVCAYTKGGELVPLGRPVDEAAAIALCAGLEDELDLLPVETIGGAIRARVAPDEDTAAVHELGPKPRAAAAETEESTP